MMINGITRGGWAWVLLCSAIGLLLATFWPGDHPYDVLHAQTAPTTVSNSRYESILGGENILPESSASQASSPSAVSNSSEKMIGGFSPKISMHDLSRRQAPILQVMGDDSATRLNIAQAAQLARSGDDSAAIAVSRVAKNPLLELRVPRDGDDQQRRSMIPSDLPDDALYWLRLGADRGDLLAQVLFVNAVMSSARWGRGPNYIVDASRLRLEEGRGLGYLDALISAGVADSLTILAAAYNEGLLGLPQDASKAYATLMVLQANLDTPETRQRLDQSRARLRLGDIDRAKALVASGQWRPAN